MSVEQKVDKLADKFGDIDKSVAVLVERVNSYLDKIEELEEDQKKEISEIKEEIAKIKKDICDMKEETRENSRVRKITNSIIWITFTSVIGLIFFWVKEKMKGTA